MRFLLIAVLFISCNNFPVGSDLAAQKLTPETSIEKLDTVKNIYSVNADPEIFETAFFAGTKARIDSLPISFYAINIGKINIESGKVIACDPIIIRDAVPFIQTFPIGRFTVQLAIVKFEDDERVGFSRILFSDSAVGKALPR